MRDRYGHALTGPVDVYIVLAESREIDAGFQIRRAAEEDFPVPGPPLMMCRKAPSSGGKPSYSETKPRQEFPPRKQVCFIVRLPIDKQISSPYNMRGKA